MTARAGRVDRGDADSQRRGAGREPRQTHLADGPGPFELLEAAVKYLRGEEP
jgi:hypothetical protein